MYIIDKYDKLCINNSYNIELYEITQKFEMAQSQITYIMWQDQK